MSANDKKKPRWEVQHYTLCDGWTNTWSEDGRALTFATRREAEAELKEFLADTREAAAEGALIEPYQASEFRIRREHDDVESTR
jgi:hypothetical protein